MRLRRCRKRSRSCGGVGGASWDGGAWDSLREDFGWVRYAFNLFLFTIFALGLRQIVAVDEQHLTPPPTSVPRSSTTLHCFAVPSFAIRGSFASFIRDQLLVSTSPAAQQHPPRETSSAMPE